MCSQKRGLFVNEMALGSFPAKFGLSLLVPTEPIANRGSAPGIRDMTFNEFPVRFPVSCPPNLTMFGFSLAGLCYQILPNALAFPHSCPLSKGRIQIRDTEKFIRQINTGSL